MRAAYLAVPDQLIIRAKRILDQAQERIDQILAVAADRATRQRLLQVATYIHEARIGLLTDGHGKCSDSVTSARESDDPE